MAYGPLDLGTRLDVLFAGMMALFANIWRGENEPAMSPADFMPDWSGADAAPPQTVGQQMGMAELITAAQTEIAKQEKTPGL